MIAKKKPVPRGIRNNNPTNIRIGNTWLGERDNPTDSQFEEFVAMEYGLRAAFCILRRYFKRYHRDTVELIIRSWAPETENQTAAYIAKVCKETGLNPDERIRFEDRETMVKLVSAMCLVECGCSVPADKVYKGYDMA